MISDAAICDSHRIISSTASPDAVRPAVAPGTQAKIEPASLAILHLNMVGIVTAVDGNANDLGLQSHLIGQSLAEALGWSLPPISFELANRPLRLSGLSRTGKAVVVDVCCVGTGGILAIVREREEDFLPPRLHQLCGLGAISSSVAHEINNALTILYGWLEVLKVDACKDGRAESTMSLLLGESRRIGMLTRNLQQVARGTLEKPNKLDLKALINDIGELVQYEMQKNRVDLHVEIDTELPHVTGKVGTLKQAILNLLINARQAMPDGGLIELQARGQDGRIVITVRDTGCGIPSELLGRVFTPFCTTKPDGNGLGLSITKRIVEDHGGTLRLASKQGEGTLVTIELPADPEP